MADDLLPSLTDLDRRLKAARMAATGSPDGIPPEVPPAPSSENWGSAMRLGVELASGLVVGGLMGWGLDRWLGTKPWLMIVFFLLGAAAGMINVLRATRVQGGEPPGGAPKNGG